MPKTRLSVHAQPHNDRIRVGLYTGDPHANSKHVDLSVEEARKLIDGLHAAVERITPLHSYETYHYEQETI